MSLPLDLGFAAPAAVDVLAGIVEKVESERQDHDANADEGGRDLDP